MRKIKFKIGKCNWQHIILFGVAVFFVIFRPIFPVVVSGNSMLPTYHNGDKLLAANISNIHVGDVVIINMPDGQIIKRVAYIAGDTYTILHTKIKSNQDMDMLLPANFTKNNEQFFDNKSDNNVITLTVPQDYIYLLGDNLQDSEDSRIFGVVPLSLVKGKVICHL